MGYQESFVTTTNKKYFGDLIDKIKANGKEYYEGNSVRPSFIVSVKENICGDYEKKVLLKKSKKYVYFTGERHLQRSSDGILNVFGNDDTVLNLDIAFAEEVDCAKIFDTNKKDDGAIYAGLSNKWVDVEKFVF